jgi:hypothetical protein
MQGLKGYIEMYLNNSEKDTELAAIANFRDAWLSIGKLADLIQKSSNEKVCFLYGAIILSEIYSYTIFRLKLNGTFY